MDSIPKKRTRSSNVQNTNNESSPVSGQRNVHCIDEDAERQRQKGQEENDIDDSFQSQYVYNRKIQRLDRITCPYLDTISRSVLDFDSEKLCSVTMVNMNIYSCLVCGKFFQGRGKQTPAYTHSVQNGHFVFMNLESGRFWCLPENYEVIDSSLTDLQRSLSPSFTPAEICALNCNTSLARDISGVSYLPGFVGLNNLNCTDYANVVLHMLANVSPFRNFWLQTENYSSSQSRLVQLFGLTLRKMWSNGNFKSNVSPQELMQEVSTLSKRRFGIGQRGDCVEFFAWLLASLSVGLAKKGAAAVAAAAAATSKTSSGSSSSSSRCVDTISSVSEPFKGKVEVLSMTKHLVSSIDLGAAKAALKDEQQLKSAASATIVAALDKLSGGTDHWETKSSKGPFTLLSLDIPPCPLFRDNSKGGLCVPQVPLFELLRKFDGKTWTDTITQSSHVRKQYRIKELPQYLVFHLSRFTENNFSKEKNPTIVTFPVKNLEMKDYLFTESGIQEESVAFKEKQQHQSSIVESIPTLQDINGMIEKDLIRLIDQYGLPHHKEQFRRAAGKAKAGHSKSEDYLSCMRLIAQEVVERREMKASTKYDLLCSISHDTLNSLYSNSNVQVGDRNAVGGSGSNGGDRKAKGHYSKSASASSLSTSTDLSGINIVGEGNFKVNVNSKATGQWFEINDLRVTETSAQLIGVSEAYVLLYEKKMRN